MAEYPRTTSKLVGANCALETLVPIESVGGFRSIVSSGAVPGSTSLPGTAGPYTYAVMLPGIADENGFN